MHAHVSKHIGCQDHTEKKLSWLNRVNVCFLAKVRAEINFPAKRCKSEKVIVCESQL